MTRAGKQKQLEQSNGEIQHKINSATVETASYPSSRVLEEEIITANNNSDNRCSCEVKKQLHKLDKFLNAHQQREKKLEDKCCELQQQLRATEKALNDKCSALRDTEKALRDAEKAHIATIHAFTTLPQYQHEVQQVQMDDDPLL